MMMNDAIERLKLILDDDTGARLDSMLLVMATIGEVPTNV